MPRLYASEIQISFSLRVRFSGEKRLSSLVYAGDQ